jgi:hypothetical protein
MNEHAAESDRSQFWRDALERIIRAFAQGMLAGLGVGYETFDKGGLPWLDSFYIGAGCAIIALLISLAGGKVGDPRNGSLLKTPPQTPPPTPPEQPHE